ncbi:MAG: DNA polymerase III subunit chi [Methylotenera sp.]|nr:DNA polymerase III subunit chi [Methylotenera sp.]
MTRIEFFSNVPDKYVKIAELCDKAVAKGRQLTIIVQNNNIAQQLQQQLWQHSSTSFLPSAHLEDTTSKFAPIIFQTHTNTHIQDDVLINCHHETPAFFSRFRYLVELVGTDESDKVAARTRYRFYRERGYEIKMTDMAKLI